MQRFLYKELLAWKQSKERKPLLLRGARQVGKSYLVNEFGNQEFSNCVTINFELEEEFIEHFNSPDPRKIINKIFLLKGEEIKPGVTLLFLDEIQLCPKAITSLRYFYEKMPELHVIAAGSLLDFTLNKEEVSVPVGRLDYLYIDPMSFKEYLLATQQAGLCDYIEALNLKTEFDQSIHDRLKVEIKNYMLLGGMPAVIQSYIQNDLSFTAAFKVKASLLETFEDDFKKYGTKAEQRYLKLVFNTMHSQIGKKFICSRVDSEQKSRDIKNALNLLVDACLIKKVSQTSPHSMPLAALASDKHFKTIFLDCGLVQTLSGLKPEHVLEEEFESSLAGALAEQYVGQELIALSNPYTKRALFYWSREGRGASAEIDYLLELSGRLIPIEVKAGNSGRLKSLKVFMKDYELSLGIKVSLEPLSFGREILRVPFYAVSELERLLKEPYSS